MVQYVANFFDDNERYKSYLLTAENEPEDNRELVAWHMKLTEAKEIIGHGLIGYICEKNLQSLARIPILLLFICLLWQEEQQSGEGSQALPASYTLLYEKLIELLIRRRYSAKTKKAVNIFTEKLRQTFIDLGKLALDGLLNPDGGLVFDDDDLQSIPHLEELYSIGLLSRSKVHCGLDVMHAITFPHKTIQEFFAAKYLIQTIEKDDSILEDFLKQLETQEQLLDFQHVLRFACGLSKTATSKILIKASHTAEIYLVGEITIGWLDIHVYLAYAKSYLRRHTALCNDLLFEQWNAYSNKNKALPPELHHWRRVLVLPYSLEHYDPTFQQVLQGSAPSDPQPCDFQDVRVIAFYSAWKDDTAENKLSAVLNKCKIYRNLTIFFMDLYGYSMNELGIDLICHIISNAPNLRIMLSLSPYINHEISISSLQSPANMHYLHILVDLNISEQDITKLRQMTSLEYVSFRGSLAEHTSAHCASLGELPQISHHLTDIEFEHIPLGAAGVQLLGENLHYVPHLTRLKLYHVFNNRDDALLGENLHYVPHLAWLELCDVFNYRDDDRCRTRCMCLERSDQHYQYDKCEHVCSALTKLSEGVTHTIKLKEFSFSCNHISRCHGISSPLISLIQSLSTVSQQTDMSIDMSRNKLGYVDHLSDLMKAIVSSCQHVAEWDLKYNEFGDNVTLLSHGLDKLHSVKLWRIDIRGNGDVEARRRVNQSLRNMCLRLHVNYI